MLTRRALGSSTNHRRPNGGGEVGRRSQASARRPRTENRANAPGWSATIRRDRLESATTRAATTARGGSQPACSASMRPRRALTSRRPVVSCVSPTALFTSTTSNVPDGMSRASTSTRPRSPKWLKLTSVRVSQPRSWSCLTHASITAACAASARRSSSSPCHRTVNPSDASSAVQTRTSARNGIEATSPRSMREIAARDTFARAARSRCRHRLRRRSSRMAPGTFVRSMRR